MHRTIAAACAALLAMLALSGCNWQGEGKQVAAAIVATSQVKTRAFTGSMKMDMSKMTKLSGTSSSDTPSSMTMTFSGAIDATNEAKPKMVMSMTAEGQTTSMVAPGDGRFYVTSGGKSYWTESPKGAASKTINPQKIYVALGEAVGDFQKTRPLTNAQGKPVETITATVDKTKLCGAVLDAFGEAMDQAGGLGALGGSTAATGTGSAGGEKMMQNFCKMMLKSDPRVWFGIDGGKLTDVDLTAEITVPMAGTMGIEVQYHEYNQDQPQSGFDAPAGAQPLPTGGLGGFS